MARKVVLAGACRTAIGTMGGTLSNTPAPDLGTVVIKEELKRAGVAPEMVDEVYMGADCGLCHFFGASAMSSSCRHKGIRFI